MNLKEAQQEAIKLGGKVEFDLVSRVGRGRCCWNDADFGIFSIMTRNGREIEPGVYLVSDAIWDDGFTVENQKRVDLPQKQEPAKRSKMTVGKLIEKLQFLPPDATVKTWDCYNDEATDFVVVSVDKEGSVFVAYSQIGNKVI